MLGRTVRASRAGWMPFGAALEQQGSFYDDGTSDFRAVIQAERLSGTRGSWRGLVEPNRFRMSFDTRLLALAENGPAVSFFWNVNAVMSLLWVERGSITTTFDPLLDVEKARQHGADLPFGDHPSAAAFALIERWTGITVTEAWFVGSKPTFVVQTSTP